MDAQLFCKTGRPDRLVRTPVERAQARHEGFVPAEDSNALESPAPEVAPEVRDLQVLLAEEQQPRKSRKTTPAE